MKKSTIITIVCFAIGVLLLAGCFVLFTDNNISNKLFTTTTTTTTTAPTGGDTEPKQEYAPMDFTKEDISKYITLGQYKGLEVEVDQLTVSESEIDFQIYLLLCQKGEHMKNRDTSGKIAEKLIFNFDFTGYFVNDDGTIGEAFEGGAGTDQLAYIDGTNFFTVISTGTNGFIDGFAQGMLGMRVGETKKIDITFPADYYNADMAGKKTVFEVKVNYIANTEFTDTLADYVSNGQYKTVKEYRDYLRKSVNTQLENLNNQLIWSKALENVTVIEIPQQHYDYVYYSYAEQLQSYADMMGMSLDDFLKTGYGAAYFRINAYSLEQFKALVNEMVKEEIFIQAVINAEQFEMTEEEYNEVLDDLIEELGTTVEQLYADYTEDFIRDYIRQDVLTNKVIELILSQNKVVEKK